MIKLLQNLSFILASVSPRRIEILSDLNLKFECVKPSYLEKPPAKDVIPSVYCKENAYLKTLSVAKKNMDKLVTGFDTIVETEGIILGKPATDEIAFSMLKSLSGKTHKVITAYSFINLKKNFIVKKSVETEVTFKTLTTDDINWYISTKEPFDKAGAYAIQGIGSFMIAKIKGSFTNVVGLPLTEFLDDLFYYNSKFS